MAAGNAVALERASADSIILDDRFEIQPQLPMAELSHGHAQAFAAVDREDVSRKAYALIIGHDLPVREKALLALKGVGKRGLVLPVGWGAVDWPATGTRRMAIILERPGGKRLVSPGQQEIIPIPAKRLMTEFLTPIIPLLRDLGDMRVTHRAIRADNLYQADDGAVFVLGECFSAPPGYAQPAIYETIQRAMAMREGRGQGARADDYYALGVTLAVLAMGSGAAPGPADDDIIAAKMELGSYAAVTGGRRPPTEFAEILRGLLCDDPVLRWGAEELDQWLLGQRKNPQAPPQEAQASRGFTFAGQDHKTMRSLALALSGNWDHARAIVMDEELERWVRLSVKRTAAADAIAGCRVSGQTGPRMISDDLLIARTITVLDPGGPLRFRRFAAMPDGMGPALAAGMQDGEVANFFAEMITGMLPAFRVAQEPNAGASMLSLQDTGLTLRRHLAARGSGFGLERCLYELNPTLHCLSPRVHKYLATSVADLLKAMDQEAASEDAPVDRHIAAYLAAHLRTDIDRDLNQLALASSPGETVLAHLQLLALAQQEAGAVPLPKLSTAFVQQFGPAINDYDNLPLRKRIRDAAEKAADQGQLNGLLAVIDSRQTRSWDTSHSQQARARFAAIQLQIKRLKIAGQQRQLAADKLGHKWAASLGTIIAVSAVAAIFFTQVT